jgi:hypothetical protein
MTGLSCAVIRGGRAVAYAMPVPVSGLDACFAEAAELLRALVALDPCDSRCAALAALEGMG